MFKKIISTVVLGGLGLLLAKLFGDAKSGFVKMLALLPLLAVLWIISSDDDWEESGTSLLDRLAGRVALIYGFGASAFMIVVGIVGMTAERNHWSTILSYALPLGLMGLVAMLIALWRRTR